MTEPLEHLRYCHCKSCKKLSGGIGTVRPEAHIFVRSVAHWETLPDDGLERFETRPQAARDITLFSTKEGER